MIPVMASICFREYCFGGVVGDSIVLGLGLTISCDSLGNAVPPTDNIDGSPFVIHGVDLPVGSSRFL